MQISHDSVKPYYSRDGIQIYNADCRELMQELPKFDLICTDPPYGIALDTDYTKRKNRLDTDYTKRKNRTIESKKYEEIANDKKVIDFSFLFGVSKQCVIFGANNFPQQLPFNALKDGWIVWDKRITEEADKILGSPFELAVVFGRRTYKIIRLLHCGVISANSEMREHPTQKPTELMVRIIKLFPKEHSVLDPFMGVGATLLACKKLGQRCCGIEIEEKYCEIAAKRLDACGVLFT